MDFSDTLQQELFIIGDLTITLGRLLLSSLGLLAFFVIAYLIFQRWLPRFFEHEQAEAKYRWKVRRMVFLSLALILILLGFTAIGFDLTLFEGFNKGDENAKVYRVDLTLVRILKAILIFQLAQLINWIVSELIIGSYQRRRSAIQDQQSVLARQKASNLLRPVVFLLAAMLIINDFDLNFQLFQLGIPAEGTEQATPKWFRLNHILGALLILMLARVVTWLSSQVLLSSYYQRKEIDVGSQFAINRLFAYLIYVIAILQALQFMGLNLTLLWGGAAALLVGIGLGLQQTFNDLICGIIILFERTVEVGDMVQMENLIGVVRSIGIRTSLVETRDSITVIVPNSKLVGDAVINWSHADRKARFHVDVGVAYGSDTQLVRDILEEAASKHKKVLQSPAPFARFINFGDSSLDFQIHFWSREFNRIEDVKSDLRFVIDQKFRENNVSIPFPQRDLWIKEMPFEGRGARGEERASDEEEEERE